MSEQPHKLLTIWMINQYALPQSEVGHTRHFFLAKALRERGHSVTVISSNFNHFSGEYLADVNREQSELKTHDGVPFLWLPVPTYSGNSFGRIKNMMSFARLVVKKKHFKTLPKPDVIIGSSPQPFAAFASYLLAKKMGCQFVLEIRDLWPESLIDLGNLSTKHPMVLLVRRLVNHLYKKSSKVISLLPNSMDYLTKLGVAPDKIVWAPNFVNMATIPKPADNSGPFTIMYAGSHGLANGLDSVVQAAKILKQQGFENRVQFVLIGHGAEKPGLQEFVHRNQLANVKFLDVISKTKIFDVLNQADAFLMLLQDSPVFQYGISPNKLFDYLALGKPVISNIAAKFHPDSPDAGVIYVRPNEPIALADAINELINKDKTTLEQIGVRGRQVVYDYFTVEQVASTVEAALTGN